VLIGAAVVLLTASAALCGGRLRLLAALRLRGVWAATAGIAAQVVLFTLAPGGSPLLHRAGHVATYGLALAVLWLNRRLPGVRLLAAGAAANLAAIVANGGEMPASAAALRAAALAVAPAGNVNSGVVAHARLAGLGDVLATPAWLPLHNVLSLGDVLIVAGAALLAHAATGSRLARIRLRGPRWTLHAGTAAHRLLRLEAPAARDVVLVADGPAGLTVIPPLPSAGPRLGFAVPAALPGGTRLFALADGRALPLRA
jgi:uncharacterized protein DUF5317